MRQVVSQQPVHTQDQGQAIATAAAVINLLRDDSTQDVSVSINGSVQTSNGLVDSVDITVRAALVGRNRKTPVGPFNPAAPDPFAAVVDGQVPTYGPDGPYANSNHK